MDVLKAAGTTAVSCSTLSTLTVLHVFMKYCEVLDIRMMTSAVTEAY